MFVGSEGENFYGSPQNSPPSLYYSAELAHIADTYDNPNAPDKQADLYRNHWSNAESNQNVTDSLDGIKKKITITLFLFNLSHCFFSGDSWLSEDNDSALLERILAQTEVLHSDYQMADVSAVGSSNVSQSEIFEEIYRECEALSPTGQSESNSESSGPPQYVCMTNMGNSQLTLNGPADCQLVQLVMVVPVSNEVLQPSCGYGQPAAERIASDHNFYGKSTSGRGKGRQQQVVSPADTVGNSSGSSQCGDESSSTVKPARKERKKVQNRTAAYRYRLKKRLEKEGRQVEISHLESINKRLTAEAEDLQREIGYLKSLMSEMFQKAKG